MTIYYSTSPRGFYDDADFGPRILQVPDPQWLLPTQSVELLPGESILVKGEVLTNTSMDPITVPDVVEESVTPPLISMANPACRIPQDALPISNERHLELLEGQAEGKLIREDAEGNPILVDLPPPTPEQLAADGRRWRDQELALYDQMVTRHRDERDLRQPSTLSDEQYLALLLYRRHLRDWPESADFPAGDKRPRLVL